MLQHALSFPDSAPQKVGRMVLHKVENNKESQKHLEENEIRFTEQCLKVLKLLVQGHRLTVKSAMVDYNINSLPRRIKDLKENGIVISDFWTGGTHMGNKVKEYYLEPSEIQRVKREFQIS